MTRTQVQLTDRQIEALRRVSAVTGKSIAGLIREGVDRYLVQRNELGREERIERAIAIAGKFSSGVTDVSSNHDEHLAKAFGQ